MDNENLVIALASYRPEVDREETGYIICQFCKQKVVDVYYWAWTPYPHREGCPVAASQRQLDEKRNQPPLDDHPR